MLSWLNADLGQSPAGANGRMMASRRGVFVAAMLHMLELPRHQMRRRALVTLTAWLFALLQMFAHGCIAAPVAAAAPGGDPCPVVDASGSDPAPTPERTPCAKFCSDEAGGVTSTKLPALPESIALPVVAVASLPGLFTPDAAPGGAWATAPPPAQPPLRISYQRLSL